MALFKPSPVEVQNWEALAWLEITASLDWMNRQIPALPSQTLAFHAVKAVSPARTGTCPFALYWSRMEPGGLERVEIPRYIMAHALARRQACWIIAGFLLAGKREGDAGQRQWRRIARAGGIWSALVPSWSRALALHRLESKALIILAGAGRLCWARLKVPGILSWGWRIRHKDLEGSGWLGAQLPLAKEQAFKAQLQGDAVWNLAVDQASLECSVLADLLRRDEPAQREVFSRLSRSLGMLAQSLEGTPCKPPKPGSDLEADINEAILHRKVNNREIIAILAKVEELQLNHIHPPALMEG